MIKRSIVFGNYNTAAKGWTLTSWKLSDAMQKTHYIDKPGGDGSWDFSTVLSQGIPRYSNRQLAAFFECSEGDRMSREALIRDMVNTLDGMEVDIYLPDDPHHYVRGLLHVAREYNDMAHARVSVTATCEPWKYADIETNITLTAATDKQTATIVNGGRRAVVPVLRVTGKGASILLQCGLASLALSEGTHKWPDLLLTPGSHDLTYSGSGSLVVIFREAVLE